MSGGERSRKDFGTTRVFGSSCAWESRIIMLSPRILTMYLPYDLGALLLVAAFVIPRSLPRLRRRPPLPAELQLRSLRDTELSEKQRSFFSLFDQKLESLGYHCFCTYTATNTGGKGLSRNYVNPSDPANCTVILVEI